MHQGARGFFSRTRCKAHKNILYHSRYSLLQIPSSVIRIVNDTELYILIVDRILPRDLSNICMSKDKNVLSVSLNTLITVFLGFFR